MSRRLMFSSSFGLLFLFSIQNQNASPPTPPQCLKNHPKSLILQSYYFNFRAKNDIVTNSNQNIGIFAPKKISDLWRENSKMLLSYLFRATKNFFFLEQEENSLLTLLAIFQIETHTLDAFSESSERQLSLKMCSATTTAPLAFVD